MDRRSSRGVDLQADGLEVGLVEGRVNLLLGILETDTSVAGDAAREGDEGVEPLQQEWKMFIFCSAGLCCLWNNNEQCIISKYYKSNVLFFVFLERFVFHGFPTFTYLPELFNIYLWKY